MGSKGCPVSLYKWWRWANGSHVSNTTIMSGSVVHLTLVKALCNQTFYEQQHRQSSSHYLRSENSKNSAENKLIPHPISEIEKSPVQLLSFPCGCMGESD
ncbi:hypothetical protein KIL84_019441 [Mauremys mutica]|uniref:Uncharacterized protein n=1 Tax=Mauremys mutica TaxID=74926 RepID=A0A9D3XVN1_9SAUR|nr:hypothetical protein KIL84_019441 [Mauremys mutica]